MITDVDNVQTSKLKGYNANHKVQYSKFNTQSSKFKGKRVQCSKGKVQREKGGLFFIEFDLPSLSMRRLGSL